MPLQNRSSIKKVRLMGRIAPHLWPRSPQRRALARGCVLRPKVSRPLAQLAIEWPYPSTFPCPGSPGQRQRQPLHPETSARLGTRMFPTLKGRLSKRKRQPSHPETTARLGTRLFPTLKGPLPRKRRNQSACHLDATLDDLHSADGDTKHDRQ